MVYCTVLMWCGIQQELSSVLFTSDENDSSVVTSATSSQQHRQMRMFFFWTVCLVTFRMRHSWSKMCIGHGHLCVCLSVFHRIPTLLHGPGCNLGEWYGVPCSCALLGRFAIDAQVLLLWQYSAERKMSECACVWLWPPCVADADIIFLPCGFFFLLIFFLA